MNHETFDQLTQQLKNTLSYLSDPETHEILYMSPLAMERFQVQDPAGYYGRKCYQVLHHADHPCTFCPNNRADRTEPASWLQYNQQLRTWMLTTDHLHDCGGQLLHAAVMEELADNQLRQPELTEKLNVETILLQCVQALSRPHSLDSAVSAFLEMISRFYCAHRAYIFEFDNENQTLSNTFEWCAEGISPEAANLQNLPLSVVSEWLVRFRKDGEFFISSIDTDLDPASIDYQLLASQQVKSLVSAPFYSDGRIAGFIGVDNPSANLHNINLLRAASDFVALELERGRMMAGLEYLSYTDTLTGVWNRRKYVHDLNQRYRDVPSQLGIILVNINGLKGINASLGQKHGDSIIVQTASILKQLLPCDVYRIGGDDFLIPCPDMERNPFLRLERALRVAFEQELTYSVSIGASWNCFDVDIDTLILQADEQMRAEKQAYYKNSYTAGAVSSAAPASDVLKEIAEGRFQVYYQPKVDLKSRKITGAEALVRRMDKDGTLIPPSQFIPQYEARSVLTHVDFHVLHMALGAVRTLRDNGVDLCMAINFSRSTLLTPDFIARVLSACEQYGVPPSGIMLEVTETLATIDRDRLSELLHSIQKAGLRLSLDDFGSKYSNTSILTDIAFDEVKLDKTLVNDICRSERARIILRNLLQMCSELGDVPVVAEGIENEEQAALLKDYACSRGQGFCFYRPMALNEFTNLLIDTPHT